MNDRVGPWVRRFLVEYLIGERNYSLHTQQSRRDTFVLFLPFAAKRRRCALEQLALSQINPKLVREFVRHLEQVRHCSPSTINQRVISLRAWARFVGSSRKLGSGASHMVGRSEEHTSELQSPMYLV